MQLTLPITNLIPHNIDAYNADDFIVSSSNKIAYEAMHKWQDDIWGTQPYKYTLFLIGPHSSGKTYLTKIWQKLSNAHIIRPDQQFTYQILNKYQAFIIDEIRDFKVEDELLHIFNLLNEHHKFLLITSSLPLPNFNLNDLSSRISCLLNIHIDKPDEELVKILLFKNFSNLSIIMSPAVLNFLAFNLPRQFDKILELTYKINQIALSNNRKITIPLVKSILSE